MVWDVTNVSGVAPSRINQGSLFIPARNHPTESEASKSEKFHEWVVNAYTFAADAF